MRQAELLSIFNEGKTPHICMHAYTLDTSWEKRLLPGKSFLLSHLQGKKKKEANSFSC